MDKFKGLVLAFVAVFLISMSKIECQIRSPLLRNQPLCVSQLAILNHACSALPVSPISPPPPPPPPSPDDEEGQGHRHGHRHRHGHSSQSSYQQTPEEGECCRWLKQVDSECVCQLLIHLPPFLARPAHQITVDVDESCSVSFLCEGRIRL